MTRRPGTTGGGPAAQASGDDRRTVPQTPQGSLASYWAIVLRRFRDYLHHGGTRDRDGAPR